MLVAAIAVAVLGTCVIGAQTPEQKACCAAMQHGCGEMALATSCCAGERQTDPGMVVAKAAATLFALDSPVGTAAAFLVPIASDAARAFGLDTVTVEPPGVPTYLLVSSFRI